MSWSYDALAGIYATDMGASMPFDDVAWYLERCGARCGRVLELGCGTGRVLLPLLAAGVDAIGIDRSLPMLLQLRSDAQRRGLASPRLLQMDLRSLALDATFATVLAPYSLVTYCASRDDLMRFLAAARNLIGSDGVLVLDAFIPRDMASFDEFRLDYRRSHRDGTLERCKRVAVGDDGCNTIERRYRLFDAAGAERECFTTRETIRPYTAAALRDAAADAGLRCRNEVLDYGQTSDPQTARFASLEFVRD